MQPYDHKKIEPKWQKIWAKNKAGVAKDPKAKAATKKFYSLIEFPYPSGDGLHVGHIRSNTAMDIISHKRRREGYDVLYPIGWDAFGLPTENYAIKTGIQPAVVTKRNTDTFRRQLKSLGFFFDWSREINTTDPKYYKWTQWIFLQFLKADLAYKKKMTVNWCPKDLTVLANEEVIDGRCERCGTPIEKREKEQWMLAITKYADKLLEGLDATECDEPKFVDHVNPPRPGKRVVERDNVHAIVFDPKTKKYLIIRNKKHGWDTVVIGGIENGENIVEAARREVREETGYTDIELKRTLGGPVEASYFAKHKDENRIAHARAVCFELKSDARVPITDDNGEGNEILWIDESDFVPGKMVNSELPVWLARMSVRVERDEQDPNVLRFTEISGQSAFRPDMPTVERNPVAVIVKHWKEDKYIGLKWKKVPWQTIITGGPEGNQTPEEGAATEIIEETGYINPKFVRKLGRIDAKFFHNPKNVNRLGHFDVLYFELKNGEHRELTEEEKTNHDVVWLTKEEMSKFISPAAQKYIWETMFLGKPSWFDEPRPLLDWPESIKDSQRNWIGKSEGAEFDFRLAVKDNKTRFVILHGFEGSAKTNFIPWLKSELEKRGHEVEAPELPNSFHPKESEQVDYVLKNCKFDENTVMVGHSLGAIVAMKTLMKLNKPVSGLVIVAAAVDPSFHKAESRPFWTNFTWDFDYDAICRQTSGRIAILSDLHEKFRSKYLRHLAEKLHARLVETNAVEEHFCAEKEPEVLKSVTPVVTVFTTRPDTLFGVTYVVLAPEHPWVQALLLQIENKKEAEEYITKAKNQTDMVRADAKREKTGVELKGVKAINPANGEEVPVWIADYVLADYGTGAVMAVPAHDERDFEFAKKYKLPLRHVIAWETGMKRPNEERRDGGATINSGEFTGMSSAEAGVLIAKKFGMPKTTYKLRDWVFSRQRYWGEPIPVVHCEKCGIVPVPEKDLPVRLPSVKNYKPTETGESPLAAISKWVNVKCPRCASKARRETDTMPNWAGSSWYYLRYTDPKNAKAFAAQDKLKYWTPVDWYNGGMEHTTLHLLYSRFWHKFLFDRGFVPTSEPYKKRTSHGLILAKGGEKMSKSKGNVVNPDGIVEAMGADSLRLYEMFMGPFDQAIAWDENGIVGCRRFIERVWKLAEKTNAAAKNPEAEAFVHRTIKKVSEDIEAMRFNTALSALMIAVNEMEKFAEKDAGISREQYAAILLLLAPFAPHVTEELWQHMGFDKKGPAAAKSIHQAAWPVFDPSKIAGTTVRIAVQVNGKTRASIEIAAEEANAMDEQKAREKAVSLDEIKKWIYGKEIKKVIYVKGRIINIVIA